MKDTIIQGYPAYEIMTTHILFKKRFFAILGKLGFNRLEVLKIAAHLRQKGIIISADYDKYTFRQKPDWDQIIEESIWELFGKR